MCQEGLRFLGPLGTPPAPCILKFIFVINNFVFQAILGKIVKRPALLNKKLIREIKALVSSEDPYSVLSGKTMCTNDFYEGLHFQIPLL